MIYTVVQMNCLQRRRDIRLSVTNWMPPSLNWLDTKTDFIFPSPKSYLSWASLQAGSCSVFLGQIMHFFKNHVNNVLTCTVNILTDFVKKDGKIQRLKNTCSFLNYLCKEKNLLLIYFEI